jgi:putative SOS response-associated peptidase YedK
MNPGSRAVRERLYRFGPVCGRFTSSVRREALAERFQITVPETVSERYNVAPGQRVLAVRRGEDSAREATLLRWGLIPHWAKDARIAYKMINARAETLLEKSSYRALVGSRRCLIVADGFYEWKVGSDGRKQPIRFGCGRAVPASTGSRRHHGPRRAGASGASCRSSAGTRQGA